MNTQPIELSKLNSDQILDAIMNTETVTKFQEELAMKYPRDEEMEFPEEYYNELSAKLLEVTTKLFTPHTPS